MTLNKNESESNFAKGSGKVTVFVDLGGLCEAECVWVGGGGGCYCGMVVVWM